jgi:predicted short-subunit dehydrogenase-like oxidoreductase (DUF2520 family)
VTRPTGTHPFAGRIGFIGAGRLASGLALALSQHDVRVVAVSSRSGESAARLARRLPGCHAVESAQQVVDAADTVFVAVPDDEIPQAVAHVRWRTGVAAVHCSAATELAALEHAAKQGARIGGFHPLQAFADPVAAAETLPGCSVTIEAGEGLREELERLAAVLGCRTIHLPPGSRARYHAAAHYAAGFVFALVQEAVQIWQTFGVGPEETVAALVPLLRGSVAAMERSGLAQGLPGIFSRGDVGTLDGHLAAMKSLGPDHLRLYCELGLRSIPLGREHGGLSEQRAAEMRTRLLEEIAEGPGRLLSS